jgi:hypothetical protein
MAEATRERRPTNGARPPVNGSGAGFRAIDAGINQNAGEKRHLTATLLLACLAQFMVVLDVSVVNVALPSIRTGLHFSEEGGQRLHGHVRGLPAARWARR